MKLAHVRDIRASKEFFDRSTRPLDEADSGFAPQAGMMTVAQQVAHVAHTVEWFLEGAFRPEGFDLDFEAHAKEIAKVQSLAEARKALDRAYASFLEALQAKPDSEWNAPIVQGLIMGGEARTSIITATIEHTSHHRGALTVYARMLGKTSPMPYMEL